MCLKNQFMCGKAAFINNSSCYKGVIINTLITAVLKSIYYLWGFNFISFSSVLTNEVVCRAEKYNRREIAKHWSHEVSFWTLSELNWMELKIEQISMSDCDRGARSLLSHTRSGPSPWRIFARTRGLSLIMWPGFLNHKWLSQKRIHSEMYVCEAPRSVTWGIFLNALLLTYFQHFSIPLQNN